MADNRPGATARIIRWIDYRLPFVQFLNHELNEYPTPRNLSYWWNYGSLSGIMLVVMIVSGVILATQYTPSADLAFDSVERIMRDVNWGWLVRYAHMNGASMFFAIVYIHLFRGLYYGSYKAPRELLWIIGVIILLLLIATSFMGYVLPWGQMSYWAATGRLYRRRSDPAPLLRAALSTAVHHSRGGPAPLGGAPPPRLQQPARH